LLSEDALGREKEHEHPLPSLGDRPAAPSFVLLPLCTRVVRYWNSLLRTNNTFLSKINQADLLLAHKRGSWTFEVLSALREIPGADVHISAVMCRSKINMSDFRFESLRSQQHRVPYGLRICTKCNWHCVQDEEHVLLDCPSADLANLRVKHQQLFHTPSRSSNRLRDFVSQADTKGLALFGHECLECCA